MKQRWTPKDHRLARSDKFKALFLVYQILEQTLLLHRHSTMSTPPERGFLLVKKLLLLTLFVILFSACQLPAGDAAPSSGEENSPSLEPAVLITPTPTPVLPPALSGDVALQQLLLESHKRWKRLRGDATVTLYPPPGVTAEPQTNIAQIWIEQPAKAKVIVAPPQSAPIHIFISDGVNARWDMEPAQPLPANLNEPFDPPTTPSDIVYLHPLGGMLGTPVSDLIFPAGLAQRGGEYRLTGKEILAGRQTHVVEWGRAPGQLIDRFWVDVQTGVILRQQNYGKENSATPTSEIIFNFIEFDSALPPETFDLNSADLPTLATLQPTLPPDALQLSVKPGVDLVNVRSGPSTIYEVIATLAPKQVARVLGKNQEGDWWQIELDGMTGWVFAELVDFSGEASAVPVVPTPAP